MIQKTLRHKLPICALVCCFMLSMTLSACSTTPSTAIPSPGIISAETVEANEIWEWTEETECTACHAAQAIPMIACIDHGENPDLTCFTCHDNVAGLASAHKNIHNTKTPSRLKKTEVANSVCESCHDIDELADKTAESKVLTDENNTVVNPHTLPQDTNHEDITCANCHKLHDSSNLSKESAKTCASCHHAGVYECGTCHDR